MWWHPFGIQGGGNLFGYLIYAGDFFAAVKLQNLPSPAKGRTIYLFLDCLQVFPDVGVAEFFRAITA